MLGIVEIVIGVIGCIAALTFGTVRLVRNLSGWNFSKAASVRWTIFMIIALVLGVALITFGCLFLV